MDWDKLRTFYSVAKVKTLTGAAASLSLSQSAVSRQISSLEENLGLQLFNRHSRGLTLTAQGEILYRSVHDVFIKLSLTQKLLQENKQAAAGTLTIAVCSFFSALWLAPRLCKFMGKHPDIHLKLQVGEENIDLHGKEADVAVHMKESSDTSLIQKSLSTFSLKAYASTQYIKKYGFPEKISDLENHRVLAYEKNVFFSSLQANWVFSAYKKEEKKPLLPKISINSFLGVYNLVKNNVGIGILPSFVTDSNKDLQPVLKNLTPPSGSIFYLYPTELRSSKKARAFQIFLTEEFAKN